MALMVLSGIVVTRLLGTVEYGVYSFVLAFISFASIFFNFGFGAAGARVLALAGDESRERQLIAACFVFGGVISSLFSVFIFICSFGVDEIFKSNAKGILGSASIVAGALPFEIFVMQICRGANRIKFLALFNILPKLLYLGMIGVAFSMTGLTAGIALWLNLSGILGTCITVMLLLKPTFGALRRDVRIVVLETKGYGFNVYLGSIADTTTHKLDKLFIAAFVDTTWVGFYNLATTLVSPMISLSTSVAASLFKDFANEKKGIDNRVVICNFIWLLSCVAFLALGGKFLIKTLFSEEFLPAVALIFPLAVAGLFQGMYQPFNMFLNAKGKGRELRFIAIVNAATNIVGNVVLIYNFGTMGAALACLIAKGGEFALNVFFYRKLMGEDKTLSISGRVSASAGVSDRRSLEV
jgi:O-antigen/teichoic acid export membrane protein